MKALFYLLLLAGLGYIGYDYYQIKSNDLLQKDYIAAMESNNAAEARKQRVAEKAEEKRKRYLYYYRGIVDILPFVEPINVSWQDNLDSEVRKLKRCIKSALSRKQVMSDAENQKCEKILARVRSYLSSIRTKKEYNSAERYAAFSQWYPERWFHPVYDNKRRSQRNR